MSQGYLFTEDQLSASLMARCHVCRLELQCQSPRMPVYGDGRREILLVGEAPGRHEDERGVPFVGKSGQLLASVLREVGVDMDRDCWRTNAVICRPPHNKLPAAAIDHCRPNLLRAIVELRPRVVVLTGGSPIESLVRELWGESPGAVTRWVGWQIPTQRGYWLCPTYHPSYVGRMDGEGNPTARLWLKRHLAAAAALSGRPHPEGVPDYPSRVELVYDQAGAFDAILDMLSHDRPVAFDFETDRLKPDAEDAEIVCCSVSNGRRTIAFPWHGRAVQAMSELLKSPVPKVGANIKFEERWARRILGHGVRNWHWDTMQMAHVLDNRSGITSVKFQAFVRLGVPLWDRAIGPYLKAPHGKNRIREADMDELLLYCGMDSLLEYEIYESQKKEFEDGADA